MGITMEIIISKQASVVPPFFSAPGTEGAINFLVYYYHLCIIPEREATYFYTMKEGEKNPTTPWDIVELLSCVGIVKGKTSPFISGSWHWIIPYPAQPANDLPFALDFRLLFQS